MKSGLSRAEIDLLLSGTFDDCPEDEKIAVMYAQHWAESDSHTDPEAYTRLRETYGKEKAEAINLLLRMIRAGNLMGNSFDYLLYRISFGRWSR